MLCKESFSTIQEKTAHINLKHRTKNEENTQCGICEKNFSHYSILQRHISTVHLGEQNYECPVCKRKFSDRGNMQKHVRRLHGEQCTKKRRKNNIKCSTGFEKKVIIKPVETNHQGEKNIDCSECSKKFLNLYKLKRHIENVHVVNQYFDCLQCGKEFPNKCRLRRHFESVHLKIRKFECSDCGKVFSDPRPLLTHQRNFHSKTKMEKV